MVRNRSRLVVLVAGLSLVSGGLLLGGAGPSQAVPGALTFAGTGFGAIPDGGSTCGTTAGTPRNVTFTVTGMPGGAPSDVRITGLSLTHDYVGDLVVTLIAPNGTTSLVLFGRTGATTPTGFGDDSDVAGPYAFADDATGNWWAAAQAASTAIKIPAGTYRTSALGGPGSTGAATSLTGAFNGLTNANGTWTLRFIDGCGSNTGAVTAATLELAPKCAAQQVAVTGAQAKVTSASSAVSSGAAAAAAADTAAQAATAAVTKATEGLAKAKDKLKQAKTSGNAAKIAKAKKKLKAAKGKLKTAKATLSAAQQAAATAHQKLTTAQAAVAAAQEELAAAQAALQACQP